MIGVRITGQLRWSCSISFDIWSDDEPFWRNRRVRRWQVLVPLSHGQRTADADPGSDRGCAEKTLYGWADELDDARKFWWADWAKLIGDAITAVRTGEPVLYPEDEDD